MEKAIQELIKISQYAGSRTDYIQGGGGNTSVKLNEKEMIIKASGFKLKEMDETKGIVHLQYQMLKTFLDEADQLHGEELEKANKEILQKIIIPKENQETLRPSVEAGFHAVLNKYVIHTHSVYVNLLTCAKKGEKFIHTLFRESSFSYLVIPYVDPGLTLSMIIHQAIKQYKAQHQEIPEVIFLKNHGLIISTNDVESVIKLHTKVNDQIIKYFKIKNEEKIMTLIESGENLYQTTSPVILENHDLLKNPLKSLNKYPLYPDQLIFLNNVLEADPQKLILSDDKVKYKTNKKEAEIMNESLFAFLFIVGTLKRHKMKISVMNKTEVDFINNWEAEKYRKKMAEKEYK
ncbi:MAG: class II aldolase/adducin family protein [Acholeplasmataceae bacterium]|nr:class II aldolase/adducin family protein [Acholeplasmataceae bacterium]